MPQIDVSLVLQWFHIFAGMTVVGGLVYLRAVLVPTLAELNAADRAKLENGLRGRWASVVSMAIGVLLITGLANFMYVVKFYKVPTWYHQIWGIKFLLAMVVFFVSSALAGRSAMAQKMRANAAMWLNLNLLLVVVIVCLSGMLTTAEKKPRSPPTPGAVAHADLPMTAAVGPVSHLDKAW